MNARAPSSRPPRPTAPAPTAARRARGLTLVELLVALAIGLVLSLAVSAVLVNSGTLRRTSVSVDELNLSGSVLAYQLDRRLRSAGSGFSQRWSETYGCELHAARDGVQLLPAAGGAHPAPFAGVPARLRLAPVLIARAAPPGPPGGDVLITMSGTGGFSETGTRVLAGGLTTGSMLLPTALGLRPADVLLITDPSTRRCMVQGVAPAFVPTAAPTVTFGGPYAAATVAGTDLVSLGAGGRTLALQLGTDGVNGPMFSMLAVDPTRTLMQLDLLRTVPAVAAGPVPFYENVVRLRALYGVTDPGNAVGSVDRWIDPVPADPQWSIAALTDGSPQATDRLRRIVAVRVAFVVRSTAFERADVAPAQLVLFPDLDVALRDTVPIAAADRRLRHRVVDVTVPLRTVQLQTLP